MKKQALSFKNAIKGVLNTIKSESHMRFHMVAGFYVVLFSFFYNFSIAQWALLIMLIASVMAAETFNTCVEELCNLTADRFEPLVKAAKDAAAGAVLILAAASAVVAVLFFWNTAVICRVFSFFADNVLLLVLLLLSALFSVVFVAKGPVGIKSAVLCLKLKIKSSK